jgi:hypothetical protein
VLQAVDEVGDHGRDVVGDPERQARRIRVRVEHLGVLVDRGKPHGQAAAQRVEIRVVADLRLPVARQDHVAAGAELGSGEQYLGYLKQQQRHRLVAAALG